MLDRAGNADSDIQRRRDDLAGLADLPIVWHIAGIDGSARGAHACAQFIGERLEQLEVFTGTHAAATGDNDFRSRQFRAVGLREFA